MPKPQKLELTWIGKENRPKLEPRILIEDPGKSHHAIHKHSKTDIYETNSGRKEWAYLLIPHDGITEQMTFDGMVSRYKKE